MHPSPDRPAARLVALALVTFLTILPVTLVVPVLKGLVQDRYGVGDLATSLFMAANMAGAIIAAPLAGMASDRLGRRKVLVVYGLLADAALLLALAFAPGYASLMALRVLEGAAHAVALSIVLAMAADAARRTGSGRAMGAVGATLTLGVALGAPLGGRLGELGPSVPLLAGALLAVLAALVAGWLLREGPRTQPDAPQHATEVGTRHQSLWRTLWVPFAFAFVDRFTVGFFVTAFPLWMANVHGRGPAQIGMLLAFFLLPFALLSYPAGRIAERTSRVALLGGGSLLYGAGVIAMPLIGLDALPALLVLLGVLSAVMFVPNLMLTAELAPRALRASAMGGFNAAGSLGFLIGPAVAGLVSQTVGARHGPEAGYTAAFAVAGTSELLCVLLTLGALLRIARRQPRAAPAP